VTSSPRPFRTAGRSQRDTLHERAAECEAVQQRLKREAAERRRKQAAKAARPKASR
jgi:hypothetical protein